MKARNFSILVKKGKIFYWYFFEKKVSDSYKKVNLSVIFLSGDSTIFHFMNTINIFHWFC